MAEARAALILTTVGSAEDAARISRMLVEERLAACVSTVSGVRSTYRWQGAVVQEDEHLLLVKAPPSMRSQRRSRCRAVLTRSRPSSGRCRR